jgi:hypothetical protein
MAAGGPGDHPLTDILHYKLRVYGPETDELIRKIYRLSSVRESNEWWEKEIGWTPEPDVALQKAQTRYSEVLERAQENGWEIPDDCSPLK